MISNKITRRWLKNSFGVIVVIVLLIVIVAGFSIQRYYYSRVQQTMRTQADITANTLGQYSKDSSKDFISQVGGYVETFDEKDKMELMIIDSNGQIVFTSSGFMPAEKAMPDYQNALNNNQKIGTAVGSLGTKQRVMLMTYLAPVQDETSISAIRVATALTKVDKQIAGIIIGMVFLGVAVLALVLFSSSYFMNSIVRPLGQVGETARQIASGDFEARLNIKQDDEVGELAEIINYMAGELGAAEQLKNDFISSVSHELRTPLTAIQGWAETLRFDEGQDKELLDKGMGIIIGETARLSIMVEELLDFSRMQSGRMKLVKSRMDVMAELSEAVLMYTQRAQRENINIIFIETEEIAPIYGDKNRLRQVFINIIDNAIKYSNSGDTVTISTDISENYIKIVIADTGIGIKDKDLPQITTKFYKADTTRRGSGIGLAVANEIVLRHDGTLTVESEHGKGTSITIILPLYKGQDNITRVEELPPTQ